MGNPKIQDVDWLQEYVAKHRMLRERYIINEYLHIISCGSYHVETPESL